MPTPDDVLPNQVLIGDAWLGLFKSFDGGQTWRSTLLPGYPQDASKEGLDLKQRLLAKGLVFTTASDPVVRPGTNGLFYYAGIGFNRATGKGAVFVARFIDMNNRENGTAAPVGWSSQGPANTSDSRISTSCARDGARQRSTSSTLAPDPLVRDTSTTMAQRSTSHTS